MPNAFKWFSTLIILLFIAGTVISMLNVPVWFLPAPFAPFAPF